MVRSTAIRPLSVTSSPPARVFQAVQTFTQTQRRRPGGDVEGVLGRTGNPAEVTMTPERVYERVVAELTPTAGVGHGDDLALGLDSGDPGYAQPDPRAR